MTLLARPALVLQGARVLFWATLVFTFVCAVMPADAAPRLFPWDKAEHFAAFFVLTSLTIAAYPRTPLLIVALWMSLFGATIELVQALPIVHRDCDILDWVADVSGIGAAMAPILVDRWRRFSLTAKA